MAALPVLDVLPYRWRTSTTASEPPTVEQRCEYVWWGTGDTVGILVQRRLETSAFIVGMKVVKRSMELWLFDEDRTMRRSSVDSDSISRWTNATYTERRLGETHADGQPKAFLLATFYYDRSRFLVERACLPRRGLSFGTV